MNICPFKKFKNALGVPNKGVHRIHILGTAAFDYFLTIIMAFISSYLLSVPLVLSTITWFIMGIVSHILFGVKTDALRVLGISC
jgi:hypothetical protein